MVVLEVYKKNATLMDWIKVISNFIPSDGLQVGKRHPTICMLTHFQKADSI